MSAIQELIVKYGKTNDKTYFDRIIYKIRTEPKIWTVYSPVTENHYLDYVKGAPTAFIFSEYDFCEDFKKYLGASNIKTQTEECVLNDRESMFSDMYRSGIELVVVDNGRTFLYVNLSDIYAEPDYSQLPTEERPISNPELVRDADRFFQLFDSGKNGKNIESLMMKDIYNGKYLLPIISDKNLNGTKELHKVCTGEGQMLNIPALIMKNGQNYIPVFTDWIELKRFDGEKICDGNVITFKDIEYFCESGARVSINPFGFNMIIDKNVIPSIKRAADIENDGITLFELESVPGEMISELTRLFDASGAVKSAYMRGIRQNGVSGYLIIADVEQGREGTLSAVPEKTAPYAGNVPITIVKYDSAFGAQAAAGSYPFYENIKI